MEAKEISPRADLQMANKTKWPWVNMPRTKI